MEICGFIICHVINSFGYKSVVEQKLKHLIKPSKAFQLSLKANHSVVSVDRWLRQLKISISVQLETKFLWMHTNFWFLRLCVNVTRYTQT